MTDKIIIEAWGGFVDGRLMCWETGDADDDNYAIYRTREKARSYFRDVRPIEIPHTQGEEMSLIRVIEIAPPSGNYHFDRGEQQRFVEVDWFRDDGGFDDAPTMATEDGRKQIADFIRGKNYFKDGTAYLVLSETATFTIGYTADWIAAAQRDRRPKA